MACAHDLRSRCDALIPHARPSRATPQPLVLAVHTVGQVGSRRFLWGYSAGTTRHHCIEVSETTWQAFARNGGAGQPPFLVEILGAGDDAGLGRVSEDRPANWPLLRHLGPGGHVAGPSPA